MPTWMIFSSWAMASAFTLLPTYLRGTHSSSLLSYKQRFIHMMASHFRQSSTASSPQEQILVEENPVIKTVILNRPSQLNALSHWMVRRLEDVYKCWEENAETQLVIIKGSGRAFCAGGDVAEVCHLGNQGNYNQCVDFFHTEYNVNYIVGTYKKPHVAFLDGIVMGGGSGISIHGKFRVATEKTMFAMPETGLGLHPDVGASHFLSRTPGYLGEYLGLTGSRLDGAELVATGLATHYIPSKMLPELEGELRNLKNVDTEIINSMLDKFSAVVKPKQGSPFHRLAEIDRCFSKNNVEEILKALEVEGEGSNDDWFKVTRKILLKASPLSLKVTLRSIREGRYQSLAECLKREHRITVRCVLRKVSNDFYEGCRAILIDKDKNPKWNPASLGLVTPAMVDHYFLPFENEREELQLPARPYEEQATVIPSSRL